MNTHMLRTLRPSIYSSAPVLFFFFFALNPICTSFFAVENFVFAQVSKSYYCAMRHIKSDPGFLSHFVIQTKAVNVNVFLFSALKLLGISKVFRSMKRI